MLLGCTGDSGVTFSFGTDSTVALYPEESPRERLLQCLHIQWCLRELFICVFIFAQAEDKAYETFY